MHKTLKLKISILITVLSKTMAQMMCDANGWDYSILPVYPDWLSTLGELKAKHNN